MKNHVDQLEYGFQQWQIWMETDTAEGPEITIFVFGDLPFIYGMQQPVLSKRPGKSPQGQLHLQASIPLTKSRVMTEVIYSEVLPKDQTYTEVFIHGRESLIYYQGSIEMICYDSEELSDNAM